jgi:hypothetical protein
LPVLEGKSRNKKNKILDPKKEEMKGRYHDQSLRKKRFFYH